MSIEAARFGRAAVDGHYDEIGGARAGLVVCKDFTFATIVAEHVAQVRDVSPYEPGMLFKRELPCILAVQDQGEPIDLLVVDGYATLDPTGRPGLGAHAAKEFGIPVIGLAKTPFRGATRAIEVTRGAAATRRLYVTAAGLDVASAAEIVASMAGSHRIPFALARVDRLARGRSLATNNAAARLSQPSPATAFEIGKPSWISTVASPVVALFLAAEGEKRQHKPMLRNLRPNVPQNSVGMTDKSPGQIYMS